MEEWEQHVSLNWTTILNLFVILSKNSINAERLKVHPFALSHPPNNRSNHKTQKTIKWTEEKIHNLNSRISRFQKISSIFFITKFKFELKLKYKDTVSPLFFIIDLIFRWTRIKKTVPDQSFIYTYYDIWIWWWLCDDIKYFSSMLSMFLHNHTKPKPQNNLRMPVCI